MGAPGYFILCADGHVIGYISDDMYWDWDAVEIDGKFYQKACLDKGLWKLLREYENGTCKVCGKPAAYKFCHYGDINDCISGFKLRWNKKENRYIIPPGLATKQKKELEICTIKKSVKNVKNINEEGMKVINTEQLSPDKVDEIWDENDNVL